jgi:hypothetical protein
MSDNNELPFQTLIDALLDQDTPFDPRYLYRFSDLEGEELALFNEVWTEVSLDRRQALLEDLIELAAADDLLSFENIGRRTINDPDALVRTYAVQLLWEFEGRNLIPLFLELLESDPVPEVRAAAASGLGLFVYSGELDRIPEATLSEVVDSLFKAAQEDPVEIVQGRALESLGYSSHKDVSQLIEAAFTSGGHEKMASALIAMGRSMDTRWEKTVLKMLNSKIPILRTEAARAAGEIQIEDSVPLLVELTSDGDLGVRSVAIWSLSEIGGDQARHTLEQLFQETDDDQEADFIESALDNIAFTDGMQPFALFDFPEESPEDELLEMLISQDDRPESGDNGGYHFDLGEPDEGSQAEDGSLSEDEDFQA